MLCPFGRYMESQNEHKELTLTLVNRAFITIKVFVCEEHTRIHWTPRRYSWNGHSLLKDGKSRRYRRFKRNKRFLFATLSTVTLELRQFRVYPRDEILFH